MRDIHTACALAHITMVTHCNCCFAKGDRLFAFVILQSCSACSKGHSTLLATGPSHNHIFLTSAEQLQLGWCGRDVMTKEIFTLSQLLVNDKTGPLSKPPTPSLACYATLLCNDLQKGGLLPSNLVVHYGWWPCASISASCAGDKRSPRGRRVSGRNHQPYG